MKMLFAAAIAVAAIASGGTNETKIATREWVERFVSDALWQSVSHSNGVTVVESRFGGRVMRLEVEDATEKAVFATNCTAYAISQGITNGLFFVHNGTDAYINPLGVVHVAETNFVFRECASVVTNGIDHFDGWFDIIGIRLQPHVCLAVTNSIAEVVQ